METDSAIRPGPALNHPIAPADGLSHAGAADTSDNDSISGESESDWEGIHRDSFSVVDSSDDNKS